MTTLTKILAGVVIFLALALYFYFSYSTKAINSLKKSVDVLTNNLNHEQERANKLNELAIRLEEQAQEQQRQLSSFEKEVAKQAESNNEIRELLRTRIPDSLLIGLHSYAGSNSKTKSARGTNNANRDTKNGKTSNGANTVTTTKKSRNASGKS